MNDPRNVIDHEQIVRLVAEKTGLPITNISPICDALIDTIAEQLKEGRTVRLADFGTFAIPQK